MTVTVDGGTGIDKIQVAAQYLEGYVCLRDQRASNTAAQTAVSGWQTRVLQTKHADTAGLCVLTSNQFVLVAGTYRVMARSPTYRQGYGNAHIRNITDGVTVIGGGSIYVDPTSPSSLDAWIFGRFTIAAGKTLELQHNAGSAGGVLGNSSNSGEPEIFTEIQLWKEII